MNNWYLSATSTVRSGLLLLVVTGMASIANAQQPSAAQIRFFETSIRPALVKYCYECHSVEAGDSEGGLLVDTRTGLLQGGNAGPAIVPGNAEASLIWKAINWEGYEMPPSEKMPASVIADFKRWIDMGAPDPRVREIKSFSTKITKQDIEKGRREHWSFQRPRAQDDATIDGLVAKKLKEEGLRPSSAADGYTLLRRIYFDLVGIPPTPAEIKRFQAVYQTEPDRAVAAKIDQLLKLPQYGERWGRHWLDVVRYAESSGSRNTPYPHAWRYRDYVIDSFNDDTPYDRFVTEQLAGDLLKVKSDEQWQENLIATGFLAIGLKHHDEKNPRKFMSDMVDEQIDTLTQSVLGLTVACARCHDHKYDPIPTDDYYAMAGIFYSTKTYYGTSRIAQNHRPSDLLLLPLQDESSGGSSASRQRMESMKRQIAELDREMQNMRGKDRRGIRNNRNRIATQLAALNPDGSAKAFGMGVQEADRMVNANILFGGEVEKPAQEVPRGFVQVFGNLNFTETSTRSSGRLELAEAMTSKNNPLTARVMVNRIWAHLIGKPLVETPSNFGVNGMEPSNQELLDHLAIRFMQHDWSIKTMIREIMLTDTYRRSSAYNQSNYASDPDNKFLWRANPRQVDAESLRDAMLSMAGQLTFDRPQRESAPGVGSRRGGSRGNDTHRSVYLPIDRSSLPDALELFGFPDPNITSPGRPESIVPTQALYMMNDDFVIARAQGMATMLEQNFDNREDQIRMAILWSYGRPATPEELKASTQFFQEFQSTGLTFRSNTARAGSGGIGNRRGSGTRSNSAMGPGAGAGRGPGGPRGGGRGPRGNAGPALNTQTPLSVFCQTLMASASFRVLD
ncbi:MAG: PSD1 and planctomycete cytochrome C domain-containing protein [Planctomycetota bacterium]